MVGKMMGRELNPCCATFWEDEASCLPVSTDFGVTGFAAASEHASA
jgi:hypothetical protein